MSLSFWNKTSDREKAADDPENGVSGKDSGDEGVPSINAKNICNGVAYVLNIVFTYGVGVAGILGNPDNSELSRKYQTIVTPKSTAFLIWSIIFTLQAVFAVIQFLPRYRGTSIVQQGVGYWYLVLCLFQIGWTFAFAYEVIGLSLVFMILLWVALMSLVYSQYVIQEYEDSTLGRVVDLVFFRLPFSIHAGWITAASALNVNVVVVDEKQSESTQLTFAIISLAVLHAISVWKTFALKRPNFAIPAVLAWANYFIFKELEDPLLLIKETFAPVSVDAIKNSALAVCFIILGQIGVRFIYFLIAYSKGNSYLQVDDRKEK